MVFSSAIFLFYFLPITLGIYFVAQKLAGPKLSNPVLFFFSIAFYAFGEAGFVLLILVSILINYVFGLLIDHQSVFLRRHRQTILLIGVCANILLLTYFKYLGFLAESLHQIVSLLGFSWTVTWPDVHLPIGISFFTFQAISYLVDVYRGHAKCQRNLLDLGLYIALFPQLIAGPIVRYETVDKQIRKRTLTTEGICSGLRLFCVGLFMKACLADTLAYNVDAIFAHPFEQLSTHVAWVAISAYSLQIFFDFAGYSLMAIGLGRACGFTFPQNFNQPYTSLNVREFWRRWHISLSTWFRDYLYIPLGGSQRAPTRTYANLLIVFLCTGIWHGASWNFVIWGLIHGLFIVLERKGLSRLLETVPRFFSRLYLIVVVMVAWVFFRIEDFSDAATVLAKMWFPDAGGHPVYASLILNTDGWFWTIFGISLIWSLWSPRHATTIATQLVRQRPITAELVKSVGAMILYLIALIVVISNTYSPFIYFRF